MNFRWLIICAFLASSLLVACGPPPELRDARMLSDDSLITNDPCAAPCWRGITPGETAWRDARTIVEDQGFTNLEVQEGEDGAVGISWQTGGENPSCCQMVSGNGETVDYIYLQLAPDITLGEVVEVHGEPTYVLGSDFAEDQAVLLLFYPDIPMVLYAFVAGAAAGTLSETSEIISVSYLKPEDMDLVIATNNMHAWEGYQSYTDYMSGEFEITPAITLTPTPGQ